MHSKSGRLSQVAMSWCRRLASAAAARPRFAVAAASALLLATVALTLWGRATGHTLVSSETVYRTSGVPLSVSQREAAGRAVSYPASLGVLDLDLARDVAPQVGPTTHSVLSRIIAGEARLALVVVVLSCGTTRCAEERARSRSTIYNVTHWAAASPHGFPYCDVGLESRAALPAAPLLVEWERLWRLASPPRVVYLVGGDGLTEAQGATVSAEKQRFRDVVVLPSGDGYNDLHEKILHGLLALETVDVGQGDYTAVMKTDADSLVRLPQLLYGLVRLLPLAADPREDGRLGELVWGRFMVAVRRHRMHHDFPGGMGYVLTRGLVRSIAQQVRDGAPLLNPRSTGGAVASLEAEDLGTSLLLLSRPHTQVNDLPRFHDAAENPSVNAADATLTSLVVHGLKSERAWGAYVRAFAEAEARLRVVEAAARPVSLLGRHTQRCNTPVGG